MPNDWFQFKQFTIMQGNCAMKVSTDACIFGAYLAAFAGNDDNIRRMLDVGTGTGLLSLMIAQKAPNVTIDALEIDPPAARQAAINFRNSKWANRLTVYRKALQQWEGSGAATRSPVAYDLLVCNPPFFRNHLKSVSPARNIARHEGRLTAADLCQAATRWLAPRGTLAMLYPTTGWAAICQTAQSAGLFLHRRIDIYPRRRQDCNRHIGLWRRYAAVTETEQVTIYREDGTYTDKFSNLLRDYYLKL